MNKTPIPSLFKIETLGADPEFFAINTEKEVVPSSMFIEGTKKDPQPIGNGYFVQKDNILLEGNIPPAKTGQEFIANLMYLQSYFKGLLAKKACLLKCSDSMQVSDELANSEDGMSFGCSSTKNAWTLEEDDTPILSSNHRTAGFHIHIGYSSSTYYDKEEFNVLVAKAFDLFVVTPARMHYNDAIRNFNYGTLGTYRDTSYGIECRALGGYFLDKAYLPWIVFNLFKMEKYLQFIENHYAIECLDLSDIPTTLNSKFYEIAEVSIKDLLFSTSQSEQVTNQKQLKNA